jgi:hypothetical protein
LGSEERLTLHAKSPTPKPFTEITESRLRLHRVVLSYRQLAHLVTEAAILSRCESDHARRARPTAGPRVHRLIARLTDYDLEVEAEPRRVAI